MREVERNVQAFNRDVQDNLGYRYSTNAQLSARLANERFTQATLALCDMRGKKVLDIGCGDGSYTIEIYDRGAPESVVGCDPATDAIAIARQKIGDRKMTFDIVNGYALPFADNSFDVAHIRGVLHHMDDPRTALREAFRVARAVVALEPNGMNLVLKVIEKVSPYHRQHDEKSYWPGALDSWVEACGARVTGRKFANLVPMFCPDPMARALKALEPAVEALPLVRALGCGVYLFLAERPAAPGGSSAAS